MTELLSRRAKIDKVPRTSSLDSQVGDYLMENGGNLSFSKQFWKACEPNNNELRRYSSYATAISLFLQGTNVLEISADTGVKASSVYSWTKFAQAPKLAHYLRLFLRLGPASEGFVWLSTNNTPGHAVPLGPFIQVPKAILGWNDVAAVTSQLTPLQKI